LEIKKAFPIFQVSIYDNVTKSSALMELPAASARCPLRDVGRSEPGKSALTISFTRGAHQLTNRAKTFARITSVRT
jgi:hypothetical protein